MGSIQYQDRKRCIHFPSLCLTIGLTIFLMACSSPVPATSPDRPSSQVEPSQFSTSVETTPETLGQSLQISAEATIGNTTIQLEVARTPDQQAKGLMYRSHLADDRGMLFPFQPPRQVGFWMKNVQISLDMIFLRAGTVEWIARNVPPCKALPCQTYGPEVPIDQVIELRGGLTKDLGIQVGDRIEVRFLQPNREG